MKEQERRIAIAEACGWRFGETGPKGKWWAPPKGQPFIATLTKDLPDYLNDLNAMHEAEKILDANQRIDFACLLTEPNLDQCYDVMPADLHYTVNFLALHATALQRAEAFLRTLNLWKE